MIDDGDEWETSSYSSRSIDREDLTYEVGRILDRLEWMHNEQRLANSRIRQDIALTNAALVVLTLIVIAMWSGVPWSFWWIGGLSIALPFVEARGIDRVRKREEPR